MLYFHDHEWQNSLINQIYVPIAVHWLCFLIEWFSIENKASLQISHQLYNLVSFLLLSKTVQCSLFMLFFVLAESTELSMQIGVDLIVVLSHLLAISIVLFSAIYFFTVHSILSCLTMVTLSCRCI
jgi:hypothetical protein